MLSRSGNVSFFYPLLDCSHRRKLCLPELGSLSALTRKLIPPVHTSGKHFMPIWSKTLWLMAKPLLRLVRRRREKSHTPSLVDGFMPRDSHHPPHLN